MNILHEPVWVRSCLFLFWQNIFYDRKLIYRVSILFQNTVNSPIEATGLLFHREQLFIHFVQTGKYCQITCFKESCCVQDNSQLRKKWALSCEKWIKQHQTQTFRNRLRGWELFRLVLNAAYCSIINNEVNLTTLGFRLYWCHFNWLTPGKSRSRRSLIRVDETSKWTGHCWDFVSVRWCERLNHGESTQPI